MFKKNVIPEAYANQLLEHAMLNRAHTAQFLQTINTGIVTVAPNDLQRIIAYHANLADGSVDGGCLGEHSRINRCAHGLVPTLTKHTRTHFTQWIKRIAAAMTVGPMNLQFLQVGVHQDLFNFVLFFQSKPPV